MIFCAFRFHKFQSGTDIFIASKFQRGRFHETVSVGAPVFITSDLMLSNCYTYWPEMYWSPTGILVNFFSKSHGNCKCKILPGFTTIHACIMDDIAAFFEAGQKRAIHLKKNSVLIKSTVSDSW